MRLLVTTVITGSVLLLAACGDDDGGDDTAPTTTPDDVSTTTPDDDGAATTTTAGDAAATTTTDAATTTTSLGPPTLDDGSTVSTVGVDTVTFGMSLEDAQLAAGTVFVPEGPVARCTVYVPEQAPAGIRFTVADGTVERVDVREGPVRTRSGVGVGSPIQDVLARYGTQAQVVPRADGTGDDIVFVPQDESDAVFRVIFETDGAVVTSYRSGRVPVVLPSVPCGTVQLPGSPATTPS